MSGRHAVPLLAIWLAALSALAPAPRAAGFEDCVRGAASRDLAAKIGFQRGLRALIVEMRPEFRSLATTSMELQILLAEARRAKIDYLLRHDPRRIDTANGIAKFSNFGWLDEDTARFREESSAHRDLEDRISALEERNNGHPDWPRLRGYFRSELSREPRFGSLMAAFQSAQRDVAAAIAQCRRN